MGVFGVHGCEGNAIGVDQKFFQKYSGPVESAALRLLSLGAGVQSTVLSLMAAAGEIGPMPDAAIFSDTQFEPAAVYEHLDWLETQLPFPVYRVSAGNIRADSAAGCNSTGQRFAGMPFFLSGQGMGRRQCTTEYKINPIHQKIRGLVGLEKGQRAPKDILVEQWIGFSTDEFTRMAKSRHSWIVNRWPLLENGMSRNDCEQWFADRYDRPLVKSACIACPYRSNDEWRALSDEDFEAACLFDEAIRSHPKMDAQQFVHRDRIPLREVDFSTAADAGQIDWLDACDGMCGV